MPQSDNPNLTPHLRHRAAKAAIETLPSTATHEELLEAFNALVFVLFERDPSVTTQKAHLPAAVKKELDKIDKQASKVSS